MSSDDAVRTRVARAIAGENLFFGLRVNRDIAGRLRFWSVYSVALGHRPLHEDEEALLDDAHGAQLVADPRIWPLKLARIVSSYGGVLPGFCAGMLLCEESRLGPMAMLHAARMYTALGPALPPSGDELTDEALEAALRGCGYDPRRLPGFGVPFRAEDERLVSLHRCWRERGRSELPFARLYFALVRMQAARFGRRPNIVGGMAAAFLDMGFSPDQVALVGLGLGVAYFVANAAEGAAQRHPALLHLPATAYAGPAPRRSRRAGG